MKLREPAASLWKKHHKAVRRISNAPGGESRLLMGGGSVLAAEWDHRTSMDIDVLLPEREGMQDASAGGPVDLAAATGGKLVKDLPNQIGVEVDDGEIDVAAIPPDLPGLEREAEIDGRAELVLANAQILRGKLDRTDQGVKRDAFDFAVAGEADPQSLEIAVNALNRNETRVVRHNLEASDNKRSEDSEDETEGRTPKVRQVHRCAGARRVQGSGSQPLHRRRDRHRGKPAPDLDEDESGRATNQGVLGQERGGGVAVKRSGRLSESQQPERCRGASCARYTGWGRGSGRARSSTAATQAWAASAEAAAYRMGALPGPTPRAGSGEQAKGPAEAPSSARGAAASCRAASASCGAA